MAKLSKVLKEITKLSDEEQQEIKSWFEEEVETPKEEEPKEEEVKEEKKDSPKEEVKKEEPVKKEETSSTDTYKEMFDSMMKEINEKFSQFATKDEIKQITEKVEKEIPKTKDWGAQSVPSPNDDETEFDTGSILGELNEKKY